MSRSARFQAPERRHQRVRMRVASRRVATASRRHSTTKQRWERADRVHGQCQGKGLCSGRVRDSTHAHQNHWHLPTESCHSNPRSCSRFPDLKTRLGIRPNPKGKTNAGSRGPRRGGCRRRTRTGNPQGVTAIHQTGPNPATAPCRVPTAAETLSREGGDRVRAAAHKASDDGWVPVPSPSASSAHTSAGPKRKPAPRELPTRKPRRW